jgi:hypothetical protein
MRSAIAILFFGLSIAINSPGRAQAGPTFSSPEELVSRLNSSDPSLLERTATSLKLITPINHLQCTDFTKVETKPVMLAKGTETALVTVHTVCDSLFLIPLIKAQSQWEAIAPIALIDHYTAPTLELTALVRSGEQEIVVRGQYVDWGSGFQQHNLTIYKLIGRRMQIVFDQPEFLHFAPGGGVAWDECQRSTFKFVSGEGTAGITVIRETRSETVGTRKMTVYRSYSWQPDIEAFRMGGDGPQH